MIKKMLFVTLLALVGLGAAWAAADSNEDYKVIQNAVRKEKAEDSAAAGNVSWFRVEISEHGKSRVNIKLPLSLVETIAKACPQHFNPGNHCDIDLKTVLSELKKAGPLALVEITDDDALVKVWVE